jgi:mannosyltransferase
VFGRVRSSKGIDVLIDAAIKTLPQHPQATIIICGECLTSDEPYQQEQINKLIQSDLDQRVLFIGKQPFDKLPELFQGMSIVAALSREEGFGLTPLEGMASGAAVITSHAGAWPDIIENGEQGYLTETGNVNEVAKRLNELLSDKALTETMGKRARQLVEQKYSVTREAEQLTHFLLSLG